MDAGGGSLQEQEAMKDRQLITTLLLAAAAFALPPAGEAAPLFRAYLASDGSDGNACTLIAPCRLLPAALNAVADGGEIWMLDSANYNTSQVVITKSVTVLAVPGAVGSVVGVSGDAIRAVGTGKVVLRNLVVVPLPGSSATNGIYINGPDSFSIEGCVIAGHPQLGILHSGPGVLRVFDSIIRDNGYSGIEIHMAPAEIAHSTISGNAGNGVVLYAYSASITGSASISDSVLSWNGLSGLAVNSISVPLSGVRASVFRSTLSYNEAGISVWNEVGTALASVSSSTITGNIVGLMNNGTGATLESLGDNLVRQNQIQTIGTITPVGAM
jgi:hypothetical protein